MSRKDRLGACESGEMKGGRGDICTREFKASGRPDKTRATLQEKERENERERYTSCRRCALIQLFRSGQVGQGEAGIAGGSPIDACLRLDLKHQAKAGPRSPSSTPWMRFGSAPSAPRRL